MAVELTLRGNNLYSNGRVIVFANQESLLIRDRLVITKSLIRAYHVLKSNEDLSQLAYRFYSNLVQDPSKYWWVIADANEAIVNPLDLTSIVGSELAIPDIQKILLLIQ